MTLTSLLPTDSLEYKKDYRQGERRIFTYNIVDPKAEKILGVLSLAAYNQSHADSTVWSTFENIMTTRHKFTRAQVNALSLTRHGNSIAFVEFYNI